MIRRGTIAIVVVAGLSLSCSTPQAGLENARSVTSRPGDAERGDLHAVLKALQKQDPEHVGWFLPAEMMKLPVPPPPNGGRDVWAAIASMQEVVIRDYPDGYRVVVPARPSQGRLIISPRQFDIVWQMLAEKGIRGLEMERSRFGCIELIQHQTHLNANGRWADETVYSMCLPALPCAEQLAVVAEASGHIFLLDQAVLHIEPATRGHAVFPPEGFVEFAPVVWDGEWFRDAPELWQDGTLQIGLPLLLMEWRIDFYWSQDRIMVRRDQMYFPNEPRNDQNQQDFYRNITNKAIGYGVEYQRVAKAAGLPPLAPERRGTPETRPAKKD